MQYAVSPTAQLALEHAQGRRPGPGTQTFEPAHLSYIVSHEEKRQRRYDQWRKHWQPLEMAPSHAVWRKTLPNLHTIIFIIFTDVKGPPSFFSVVKQCLVIHTNSMQLNVYPGIVIRVGE